MGGTGRVKLLGSFPGREGEGLGLFLEDGNGPRVARIVFLPGVESAARDGLWREFDRAADLLHHPHVQSPLGLGEVDGRIAFAVEHADGETLAEILAVGGRLPHEVAARILRDACVAIHFAHEEGEDAGPILHGWLRPSHLLVARSGVTLVSGFGAGLARSAADLLPWQSPEQVLGGPGSASRASDVHGLGLVLHAALAGENPFEHEPDPDVAMLSRAAPRLEPLGVPGALAAVVRRALSVKGHDRFPDALAMARAIEHAVPDMASPSAVAAWSESLFPAGMGMRVLRQRAVDQAVSAAAVARQAPVPAPAPIPRPAARSARAPVPLPEPAPAPAPRIGFRPAPRHSVPATVEPRAFPRPVPPPAAPSDDAFPGEFTLAAPPFPHAGRRVDPIEAIAVDVVLPDPPPPLRLPLQQRITAPIPVARLALRRG